MRSSEHVGVKASLEGIDMEQVNTFKGGVVNQLYKGLQGLVKSRKIEFVAGNGKLVAQDTVEVDGVAYQGKNIVLASGSFARTLGQTVTDKVLTSTEALELDRVPESAIVLGGGVIGLEFASVWTSMGSTVTIIEGLDHLAPNEDVAISKNLERQFRKRKIAFKTKTMFDKVEETSDGVKVTTQDGQTFEAEILLIAVGRGPNTEGLGYEAQGVPMERGFVLANERCHTGVGNIYAVGDIVPGLQLAHRGFQQGIFVAEEIAGLNPPTIIESGIPRVTYCTPEIASVGLTEQQAKEEYGDDSVEVLEYSLAGNGKSQILGTQGFIKLVREKDGPIVGFHAIGTRMGEQVGEGQLMVNWEAYPEDLATLIHAHPTQNEAVGEAALALAGKPLHAHD